MLQKSWFAIASIVTPVLLGMCIGAVATGAVGSTALSASDSFADHFIRPWLTWFGLGVGSLQQRNEPQKADEDQHW